MMSNDMKDQVVMLLVTDRMQKSAVCDTYHQSVTEAESPEMHEIGPDPDEFNPFDDESDEFEWRSVGNYAGDDE